MQFTKYRMYLLTYFLLDAAWSVLYFIQDFPVVAVDSLPSVYHARPGEVGWLVTHLYHLRRQWNWWKSS